MDSRYTGLMQEILSADKMTIQDQRDIQQLLLAVREEGQLSDAETLRYCLDVAEYARKTAEYGMAKTGSAEEYELYWKFTLFEAPHRFEPYLYYVEKKRRPKKSFYLPRRNVLKVLVDDLQDLEERKIIHLAISLPPRVGKAIGKNAPVLTRGGWKKHGDLKVGDMVIGLDGKYKKVLAVHPRCRMDYRVDFTNGQSLTCSKEHEWLVFDRARQSMAVYTTEEITKRIIRAADGHFMFGLPHRKAIEGEEKSLRIPPYIMGLWLGCGKCGTALVRMSRDNPAIKRMRRDGVIEQETHKLGQKFTDYLIKDLLTGLKEYGILDKKRIPLDYILSSINQRMELLAGLVDSCGSVRYQQKKSYLSLKFEQNGLKEDFTMLVLSLGWQPSFRSRDAVSFRPSVKIPCEKSLDYVTAEVQTMRCIKSITPTNGIGNCITVEDGMYLVGESLIPTHNSTLCIFFMSWVMGRRPNSHNAMAGHSGILAEGFYGELLNIITSPEYAYDEVFPGVKLERKSADKLEINLGDYDRFPTITCRGIDGAWTGAIDISSDGYLYVDDLVKDRMEALSPTRLNNRYNDYLNVLVDRKNDGARELNVGTRWNTLDYIGRNEEKLRYNNEVRFRKIPALNDKNESNFEYLYGKGFSAKYFLDIKNRLDRAEWMAKYIQAPFVREGLLFPEEELKFLSDGVIDTRDYRVVAACDPAFGGGDSVSMPICLDYGVGMSKPIIDWVFNKGTVKTTVPLIVDKIIRYDIVEVEFEANSAGILYCEYIKTALKDRGYNHCRCYTKYAPVKLTKMEKIKAYSDYVKDTFIFLLPNRNGQEMEDGAYRRTSEYNDAMDELETFTAEGRNIRDDAADGITQLAMIFEDKFAPEPTRIVPSPI